VFKKASRELLYAGSRRPLGKLSYCRLNSASNRDAILALFFGASLCRADIAAIVSVDPLLLRSSMKNIASRLVALHNWVSLSTPQITRFLVVSSRALRDCDVISRLEFFIPFFSSFDRVLVVAKRNCSLFTLSLEKIIKHNIGLFHQHGVSDV
jgi:mTERF domain-containing protein